MRKTAFIGNIGNSRYAYSGDIGYAEAMPRGSGTKLKNLLELYEITDNKGNMIHGEAPSRIIESNRKDSCYIHANFMLESGWTPERISEELSKRFDLIVFSATNAIRPNLNTYCMAEILEGLKSDFIVLGISIQKLLPESTDMLHPNLVRLLKVCDKKARIFGVRGSATEKWLKTNGFNHAKALGCPSMYVYPGNILSMPVPDPSRVKSAITGGHIHGRVQRASALIQLFKGFDAHYIMQEEMHIWKEQGLLDPNQDVYNDGTGEVYKDLISGILRDIHDEEMPFSSYRWFQSPDAWRAFVSGSDFYVGDRLHGGIVAMQVGVPAVIIAEDARVIEAADFFKVPRISVRELEMATLMEVISEYLSRKNVDAFKETYISRFREFEATLKEADISLTTGANSTQRAPSYHSFAYSKKKKIRITQHIRRWLRKL